MRFRAGILVPALFMLATLAPAAPGSPPPDAEPAAPGLRKDPSPLEAAVTRVAGMLRQDALPPGPQAVAFALWLYARDGDPRDLERAGNLARRTAERDSMAVDPLYLVAQAGATTFAGAEPRFEAKTARLARWTSVPVETYAGWVLEHLHRAAALKSPPPTQEALIRAAKFLDRHLASDGDRVTAIDVPGRPAGPEASVAMLQVLLETAQLSGAPEVRIDAGHLGRDLIRRFWKDDTGRLETGDLSADRALALQADAARLLWEAGFLNDDRLLLGRARRLLEGIRAEALDRPAAAAALGLAAARLTEHPVQMVFVGPPADDLLVTLRRDGFNLFEPRRLMLNLDPGVDAARIEALGYPLELAPVLFVCVESVCSAPIQRPEGLERAVRDLVRVAHGVPE